MKLLKFVSTQIWHPWGGSEELWGRTAEELVRRGVRVQASVHAWDPPPAAYDRLRKAGVEIRERRLRPPSLAEKILTKAGLRPRKESDRDQMAAWLADGRPNLVCFADPAVVCRADWRLLCTEAGLRYVNLSQANSEIFWPDDREAEARFRAVSGAEKAFFVSEANRRLFEDQTGHRLNNAEIVRNPFDVRYEQAPAWPQTDTPLRIACVGRLEPPAKGNDLLLRVMAMEKWARRPVRVSFFGQGPMGESVRRLAGILGLEGRVEFRGFTGDVEKIWREHHLLALPSRYEGLPLALVEAMLCHRPAVVTDVGGSAEVLEDGVTGFLAAAPTVAELDRALERAWERRGELREMGLRAGQAIRRLVPPDPAAAFADRLLALARNPGGAE